MRCACALLCVVVMMSGVRPAVAATSVSAPPADRPAVEKLIPFIANPSPDTLRELAGQLDYLPEATAAEALWLVASTPDRLDTTGFFAAALGSRMPSIRRQAADVLIGQDSPDALRLVGNMLDRESDESIIRHVVGALSHRPNRKAVPALIELIQKPGAKPALVAAAGAQLRQATRANLPDNPHTWRDWWLDNSQLYE